VAYLSPSSSSGEECALLIGPTRGKLRSHAIISNCLSEKELY
jgi:hypothetical protein